MSESFIHAEYPVAKGDYTRAGEASTDIKTKTQANEGIYPSFVFVAYGPRPAALIGQPKDAPYRYRSRAGRTASMRGSERPKSICR